MRRMSLSLALTLGLAVSGTAVGATDADDAQSGEDSEGAPAPVEAAAVSDARGAAKASSKRSRRKRRVKSASKSGKPRGYVVADSALRTKALPNPSGNLFLVNIAEKEKIKINIYNGDGSYNTEAIAEVSHLLRCKRTEDERVIEPRLMAILSHVYDHFHRPIEIVSGYRNQQKQTSYHFKGSASDIRISGISPRKIRSFVEALDTGGMGVGYYPKVGFVHVDVRPPPSYRWIDNSRSNPDSPDKRPPRSWRNKRKLRS